MVLPLVAINIIINARYEKERRKNNFFILTLNFSFFTFIHLGVRQQPDKDAKHGCRGGDRRHYDLACGN